MPKKLLANDQLADVFIQNYVLATGNVSVACRNTINPATGEGIVRTTVYDWFKDPDFLKRLEEAKDQWRANLFSTAMSEATGAPKKVKRDKKTGKVLEVLERHRPNTTLLIFMMKSLDPAAHDDAYRLQLMKMGGADQMLKKHPLPKVTFAKQTPPERLIQEIAAAEAKIPEEFKKPRQVMKQITISKLDSMTPEPDEDFEDE